MPNRSNVTLLWLCDRCSFSVLRLYGIFSFLVGNKRKYLPFIFRWMTTFGGRDGSEQYFFELSSTTNHIPYSVNHFPFLLVNWECCDDVICKYVWTLCASKRGERLQSNPYIHNRKALSLLRLRLAVEMVYLVDVSMTMCFYNFHNSLRIDGMRNVAIFSPNESTQSNFVAVAIGHAHTC